MICTCRVDTNSNPPTCNFHERILEVPSQRDGRPLVDGKLGEFLLSPGRPRKNAGDVVLDRHDGALLPHVLLFVLVVEISSPAEWLIDAARVFSVLDIAPKVSIHIQKK